MTSKVHNHLAFATLAAFAASTAFAGRYWQGTVDTFWSTDGNWSEYEDGTGDIGTPNEGTSTTYWYGHPTYETIFDAAGTLNNNVCMSFGNTASEPFVWRATDPSFGFTASGKEFQVANSASRSPSHLRIDGGTYNVGTLYVAHAEKAEGGLVLNGGTMNVTKFRIGYKANSDGTLTISNGTLTVTTTEASFVAYRENAKARLAIDGGTLDMPGSSLYIGGYTDSQASAEVSGGVLNVKKFCIGGDGLNENAKDAPRGVARMTVSGGEVNALSEDCTVGSNRGEGAVSELFITGGKVVLPDEKCIYVGNGGPGRLVMSGGELVLGTYGLTIGHTSKYTYEAHVELNGGTLETACIRPQYAQRGSKLEFNGTTIKARSNRADFLEPNANLVCEVKEGGLVVDTAGYNVRIAHDLVGTGPLVKKGEGTLIIAGANNFTAANTTVLGGEVIIEPGAADGSAGGDLGTMTVHDAAFERWLTGGDFNAFEEWGANGNVSLEQPRPVVVSVNGATRTYENLEIGITTNDTLNGVSYSFSTESVAPRTMKVVAPSGEVVENVRDMGGWPLLGGNGRRIKQGVVFRGSDLDPFVGATDEQRAASALAGLKSEIDTRLSTEVVAGYPDSTDPNAPKSYAAVDADYVFCPMSGTQIDSYDNGVTTNQLRRVFSALGTPGMLPSYVHCRIGRDRTGLFGMLLLGLLGVDDAAICRDYLASNFANVGGTCSRATPETFLRYILAGTCRTSNVYVYSGNDTAYGKSVASRCRQYLEMCGVTSAEISNITMALTGETADQVLARVNAYESASGVRTVHYVAYEGSATNASHRLAPGSDLFPYKNPTRDKHAFIGWDTENPVPNGDGSVTVYGIWQMEGQCRFWADENGDEESFANGDSWDPWPGASGLMTRDTLALNKGIWKVAKLSDGDDVIVENVYVGWGTTNGTTMAREYDRGGRLDITGGMLYVTNYFCVGGAYSDRSNNVANVTGGTLKVGKLRVADCNCNGGSKCDTLNVSGTGVVEAGLVDNTLLGRSDVGLAYVNVTNGGTFATSRQVEIGYKGEAHFLLDGGTFAATNCVVNIGRNTEGAAGKGFLVVKEGDWKSGTVNIGNGVDGSCQGEASVSGGTFDVANVMVGLAGGSGLFVLDGGTVNTTAESVMGIDASCTGAMHIKSGVFNAAGDAFRVGKKGLGVLTVDGGELNGVKDLKISTVDGVPGSEFNLNGGIVRAGKLTTSANTPQTMNWNGGTLSCNGLAGDVPFFPENTSVKVNVLWNGAVYETAAGRETATDVIAQPMSGAGALVKRGGGTLSLTGALDLAGGFSVEGGKLSVGNLARTHLMEISVADGCELDLNGAEVTVTSYKVAGVAREAGVYEECNGVITVAPVDALVPDTAEWINYAGDGDVANPTNWIVRTAAGLLVRDALPDATTDVLIPAGLPRPDLDGFAMKSATLVVSGPGRVLVRNDCTPPAVAGEAVAWYDPDDIATLTMDANGGVAGIRNKGTAGASLDLVAYDSESVPTRGAMQTRKPLEFNGEKLGFKSTNSFNAVESGFTLFAVQQRTSGKSSYAVELDDASGKRLGCISQLGGTGADHANCTLRIVEAGETSEFYFQNLGNDSGKPYVFGIGADSALGVALSRRQTSTGGIQDRTGTDGTSDNKAFDSLAGDVGTDQYIYLGMRREGETKSGGLVGESLVFARRLVTAEREAIRDYLYGKWLLSYDLSNLPENLLVEEGATIDYGGGEWTFAKVGGAGTIANANITVTGTIEPGLTVGGIVTFAPGAKFDISPLDDVANGTEVVFLTANGIVGWPLRATSGKHSARLSLVDNGDGTVSLVGTLKSAGFLFHVR